MPSEIPESDWKAFRKLRELALERICERALADMDRIASDGKRSFHNRYLAIFELIHERDDQIARCFNNPRRSSAVLQLATMFSLGLVTQDELLAFTPGTRSVVKALSKPAKGARGTRSA